MLAEGQGNTQAPAGTVIRIDVYSHHIKVTRFNRRIKDSLLSYCRNLAQFGLKKVGRRFVKAMMKVFVGVTKDREEFHFHTNQLQELIRHLGNSGISERQIHLVRHVMYEPVEVEYTYIDARDARDYQAPIIDYIVDEGRTKVVTLDPGRGKTFIALRAINLLETRAFFNIKAMYIEKWIADAKEAFDLKKGDLMVVKGSAHLKRLIELGKAGELEAKIILCSNKTFYQYLKDYEYWGRDMLQLGYGCVPSDFFETLGVGIRVIDEVHQDFHLNFRQDLYSHVPKTLSLSGTLESDDEFINRMYEVMFPHHIRYHGDVRDIYIGVEGLFYTFATVDEKIRYINKALKSYSHILFEQSVMKNKPVLKQYVDMICGITQDRYVDIRQKGQKMLIFQATVDMCTITARELQRRHPTLKVTRYVSEDDYEEMLECDIIVSTLKSLGTAIDVPGLRVALLTDGLGSRQANLQCMGRLRRLKPYPDVTPEFLYLVCSDIEKQRTYHEKKKEIFRGRVVYHKEIMTQYKLT